MKIRRYENLQYIFLGRDFQYEGFAGPIFNDLKVFGVKSSVSGAQAAAAAAAAAVDGVGDELSAVLWDVDLPSFLRPKQAATANTRSIKRMSNNEKLV